MRAQVILDKSIQMLYNYFTLIVNVTRLGEFLVTNFLLKVAQICYKTWAISKNITISLKTDFSTF